MSARHRLALLAVVCSNVLPVRLVAQAGAAPTPCAADSERRRFDFWVGEWDVTTQGGTSVGKSSVQIINGGCSLLENWTSVRGSTGKSLNSYNPATSAWQQYWVDQSGNVVEFRESVSRDRSLAFLAKTLAVNGTTTLRRLTFTPLSDSTVRQHAEQSSDAGASWTTTYDFVYHRRR